MGSKYGLALTLFSASVVALGAIFALFYEVAVVNFLFQQRPMSLDKSVRSLSSNDLKEYAVVQDSALEVVWDQTGALKLNLFFSWCFFLGFLGDTSKNRTRKMFSN